MSLQPASRASRTARLSHASRARYMSGAPRHRGAIPAPDEEKAPCKATRGEVDPRACGAIVNWRASAALWLWALLLVTRVLAHPGEFGLSLFLLPGLLLAQIAALALLSRMVLLLLVELRFAC